MTTPTKSEAARLISAEEAATRLGLHRITVYRMTASGELPSIKIGRRRLIPESAITSIIAQAVEGAQA